MTEETIIKNLSYWVDTRKFPYQLPRSFIYDWECDFFVIDQKGETREFEIKISRADFLNDCKKDKHGCFDKSGPNFFYYVVPKGLIDKSEIGKKYGLIYIWDSGHLEIVKKPQRLNTFKFDQWKMLANKMYWKWRDMWKTKWLDKEITYSQYREGFNIELVEAEEIQK